MPSEAIDNGQRATVDLSSLASVVAAPAPGDPLLDGLRTGAPIGMVAIDFATRAATA